VTEQEQPFLKGYNSLKGMAYQFGQKTVEVVRNREKCG
jgi:hypothetical protein